MAWGMAYFSGAARSGGPRHRNQDPPMDFDALYQARDYLKIKRHTPGSIKFGVRPAILGDPRFKGLAASRPQEMPPGVLGVDVSPLTMSVTVRYDPALIPSGALDELFTTADPARGKAILADLAGRLGMAPNQG